MYGMNAGYMSLAEACGEVEPRPLSFIPGEDFDPSDEFDVEAVGLAMENDMYDRARAEQTKLKNKIYDLELRVIELEMGLTREEAIERFHEIQDNANDIHDLFDDRD